MLAGWVVAASAGSAQQAIPRLTAPVNDFADVLDASSEAQLDSLIRRLQAATGDVMVVATVKTFQPFADLQSYAVEMFENGGQGIGAKGKDNGVLIVLALDDRQVRIETGYGLEGFITERTAWLIENHSQAQAIYDGSIGVRARRRLHQSDDYDELMLLAECDRSGRKTGVRVPELDDALESIRGLAEMYE